MQSGPTTEGHKPSKQLDLKTSRSGLALVGPSTNTRATSRPHSRPHSAKRREHSKPLSTPASSVGSEKTREITEASFGMGESDELQIRLAVTCDHCVWYVDPDAGRMHIVAGSPTAYGYMDANPGHKARFSSPKGIINVRSVLFVA